MKASLRAEQEQDLLNRGFSRRSFGKIAALIAVGAAGGGLKLFHEAALAQQAAGGSIPSDAVKIDANENPLGPCAEARTAAKAMVDNGGRYFTDALDGF